MSVLPGEASPGNYFDILIEGEYMDNLGTHAVVNGKLILASEAVLPVQDKAVQSGFGVYESLKIVQSKVVYLEDHLHRLNQSAQGIGLSHPFTNDQISEWIYLLINTDLIVEATMRILLMGTELPILMITAQAMLKYPDTWYEQGISVITYKGERILPKYKTCSLLVNYLALHQANANKAFEALLVDRQDRVLEGTRSNFFAFKDGVLHTPDDSLVLGGVTRDKILKAAELLNIPISWEIPSLIDVHELRYDELFISSTSMGALPIASVDGITVNQTFSRTLAIHRLIRKWETQTLH